MPLFEVPILRTDCPTCIGLGELGDGSPCLTCSGSGKRQPAKAATGVNTTREGLVILTADMIDTAAKELEGQLLDDSCEARGSSLDERRYLAERVLEAGLLAAGYVVSKEL